MKKIEVTKLLNIGFKIMLDKNNFKKWKFGYIKELGNGTYYNFAFSSASYDTCFPTTFYFGIGSKDVKKISKKILPENFTIPENEFPTILSIGQKELFEAKKFPVFKYDIYTEEDVNKMVNEVSEYFTRVAFPYLESISSIEKLEELTNTELNPWKKSIGLILAKLVNNPEYEILKNKYRELLKDWNDWDKQELEKVISFLDNHSQEELLQIAESPI